MKRNNIYITLALLIGMLVGYLIFGGSNKEVQDKSEAHTHEVKKADQKWTCSMHPQIMLPEPGDCPICGMDLIPATN